MSRLPQGIGAHSTHFPLSVAPRAEASALAGKNSRGRLTVLPAAWRRAILQRNVNELCHAHIMQCGWPAGWAGAPCGGGAASGASLVTISQSPIVSGVMQH